MAFFVFAKVGKGEAMAGFRAMLKYFEIKRAFRYYIKQVGSMLPCVCSVIDHRRRQNVVKTSVIHSTTPPVPHFCSYHILTSSVIYRRTATWNLFVKCVRFLYF